jgi:hypothetical protein
VHHFTGRSLGWHDTKHASPEQHTSDELAEDGRLAEPLGQLPEQLGGHKNGRQTKKELWNGKVGHPGA